MSITIRRNPVREMMALQNAMDRFFEDSWRGFEGNDNVLALDVHESDEAYLLMANTPGVSAEDIDITLHDGVLTITAEVRTPDVKEGVRVHIQERPSGTYTRTLRLPKAVNNEGVEASYDNGVLILTLPKSVDAQPRQIPIKVNSRLAEINDSN